MPLFVYVEPSDGIKKEKQSRHPCNNACLYSMPSVDPSMRLLKRNGHAVAKPTGERLGSTRSLGVACCGLH